MYFRTIFQNNASTILIGTKPFFLQKNFFVNCLKFTGMPVLANKQTNKKKLQNIGENSNCITLKTTSYEWWSWWTIHMYRCSLAIIKTFTYFFFSKSEGLSGRTLRKLPFIAHAIYLQVSLMIK